MPSKNARRLGTGGTLYIDILIPVKYINIIYK